MNSTIRKLLGKQLSRSQFEWSYEIIDRNIQGLKANVKAIRKRDRSIMELAAVHLMRVCKAIVDATTAKITITNTIRQLGCYRQRKNESIRQTER
jgi:hypothetical protein